MHHTVEISLIIYIYIIYIYILYRNNIIHYDILTSTSFVSLQHFLFSPETCASGSPAKDGVASFWKTAELEEGLRRAIFLEFPCYLMVPVMIN